MIVTVQETIEHSRDITAEMVVAYAVKHGWTQEWIGSSSVGYKRSHTWPIVFSLPNRPSDDYDLGTSVSMIARAIGRAPHLVLADIAEGE